MTRLLRLIATVCLAAVSMAAGAQIVTDSLERVDTDSVRRAFDRARISDSTKTTTSFSARR